MGRSIVRGDKDDGEELAAAIEEDGVEVGVSEEERGRGTGGGLDLWDDDSMDEDGKGGRDAAHSSASL